VAPAVVVVVVAPRPVSAVRPAVRRTVRAVAVRAVRAAARTAVRPEVRLPVGPAHATLPVAPVRAAAAAPLAAALQFRAGVAARVQELVEEKVGHGSLDAGAGFVCVCTETSTAARW